jgi:hypothetical protein
VTTETAAVNLLSGAEKISGHAVRDVLGVDEVERQVGVLPIGNRAEIVPVGWGSDKGVVRPEGAEGASDRVGPMHLNSYLA